MSALFLRKRSHHGGSRIPALLCLMLAIGGGVAAYRHFFVRPGEGAIQLIPADAELVVTLDTSPSTQQVEAFRHIREAIQREGVDGRFDDTMAQAMSRSLICKELRPYISSSLAFALLPSDKPSQSSKPALYLALKDAAKALEILASHGTKNSENGIDYYQLPKEHGAAMLLSDYVVFAEDTPTLARIQAVRTNATPSVATLPEYQQARAALPSDANLMVFVSPNGVNSLRAQSMLTTGRNPLGKTPWLAVGFAIRDHGLETIVQVPAVAAQGSPEQEIHDIAAMDPSLFQKMPNGAYGLMAFSQPGKYWNWMAKTANEDPKTRKDLDDGLAQFEKQTGLNVPRDIVPALNGHLVLAVYPDADGSGSGLDGLAILDDANGADASALAERVRATVERESARNGGTPVHFVSAARDGATFWSLDEASKAQFQRSLTGVASSVTSLPNVNIDRNAPLLPPAAVQPPVAPIPSGSSFHIDGDNNRLTIAGNGGSVHFSPDGVSIRGNGASVDMNPNGMSVRGNGGSVDMNPNGVSVRGNGGSVDVHPDGLTVQGNGVRVHVGPNSGEADAEQFARKKSMVYAQIGHVVLLASSQAMLDKAVAAYKGSGASLATDPAFAAMQATVPPDAQNILMVDLPHIMTNLRPFLTRIMGTGTLGVTPEDITGIFGAGGTGLVGTQRYDGKVMTGSLFLPLDYDRLIHLMGKK